MIKQKLENTFRHIWMAFRLCVSMIRWYLHFVFVSVQSPENASSKNCHKMLNKTSATFPKHRVCLWVFFSILSFISFTTKLPCHLWTKTQTDTEWLNREKEWTGEKESFDQIVTIEIETELNEHLFCAKSHKSVRMMCTEMLCACVFVSIEFTARTSHSTHNWIELTT